MSDLEQSVYDDAEWQFDGSGDVALDFCLECEEGGSDKKFADCTDQKFLQINQP